MTDPKAYIKWFYRCVFLLFAGLVSYVVFQPQYNFAHWLPHSLLRDLGTPYSVVLYFESNADKLLHPLGALILTILLIGSQWPVISQPNYRTFVFLCVIMLLAEIVQWKLGRAFEISDLLLGIIGSLLACTLCTGKYDSDHNSDQNSD